MRYCELPKRWSMKTKALLLACALAAGLTAPAGSQNSDAVLIRTGGTVPATLTKAPTITTLSKSAPAERIKLKIGFTKSGTGALATTETVLRLRRKGRDNALWK